MAKRYDRARFPDGTGPWMHPAAQTKGATNLVIFNRDVVINEIMYKPPVTQGNGEFVELFCRVEDTVGTQ